MRRRVVHVRQMAFSLKDRPANCCSAAVGGTQNCGNAKMMTSGRLQMQQWAL
jgi:hypothetical protein